MQTDLKFDEDHQQLRHNAIKGHRISGGLALHRRRKGINVRYVHEDRYPV